MRALQIEEQAKEIQNNMIKLQEDLSRFEERYNKVGASLGTAVKHYDDASISFKKVYKNIHNLTDGEAGGEVQTLSVDKPLLEN